MRKILEIKVKTNSSESKIIEKDGRIVVFVKSKPENNKANIEVIGLFAKKYRNVKILKGLKSGKKMISVE